MSIVPAIPLHHRNRGLLVVAFPSLKYVASRATGQSYVLGFSDVDVVLVLDEGALQLTLDVLELFKRQWSTGGGTLRIDIPLRRVLLGLR